MLEGKFEKNCIDELRNLPNSYWPDKVDSMAIRGIPDRVGCVCGFYVAIEFKRSEREARRRTGRIVLQKKTLSEIFGAGGFSFIVYPENWDSVYNRIKTLAVLNRGENEQIRDTIFRGRKKSKQAALI